MSLDITQSHRQELLSYLGNKRILIDARKILDGGIGLYIQNLIEDLLSQQIPICAIVRLSDVEQFSWKNEIPLIREEAKPYSWDEYFNMMRRIPFKEFALFHAPHYTLPFQIPIPKIITIHDLIHCTHPERIYYPPIAWGLIATALLRADLVLTVSRSTKNLLSQWFPFGQQVSNKVVVVANRLTKRSSELAETSSVGERYIFLPTSQPKPHKGVSDFLQAFVLAKERLKNSLPKEHKLLNELSIKLVVAGYGAELLSQDARIVSLVGECRDVVFKGKLTESELFSAYASATFVAVPSRAEGFGFTCLEAHAQRQAVIMRPVPALLELKQKIDFVAKDFSLGALTDVICDTLLNESSISESDRYQTRENALSYDSQRVLSQLLPAYTRVLKERA